MIRIRSLLRRLSADRRGSATIEFAIWSGLFFMGMLTALDFAMLRTQQLRISSAIEQGGVFAFNSRATLDTTGTTGTDSLKTYVAAVAKAANGSAVTVTAGCNGGTNNCVASNRQCVCMSTAANGTTTYTAAASCGASCTGNTTAGYYLKIHASHVYHSAILPSDMLNGKTIGDTVVVRLQ